MISLRLVVDTNIVVSAALKPDGLQRTVLLLAVTKPARLYVSAAIVAEYRAVLARPELQIRKGLRQQLLQLIEKNARSVTAVRRLQVTTCCPRGLSHYGEYPALSEVLEEDENHSISRVP
jgi:predicted nucleic acid-binding protein